MRAGIKKVFGGIASITEFGANVAGIFALIGAIYAFIYPASVANYAANFEDLMNEARQDIGKIAASAESISVNTASTAENTALLAKAIPNWLTFNGAPQEKVFFSEPVTYFTGVELVNRSPFPIFFNIKALAGPEILAEEGAVVMPGESTGFDIQSDRSLDEIIYCLQGTSDAFPSKTLFERRVYNSRDLKEANQSFEQIIGC